MDAQASLQLLQELNRQLDLSSSVEQDATPTPKISKGAVITTLSGQGDPYRLLLSSLRENLLECLKLPYDSQRRESFRPLDLPIWKILAFCEPSWFIDPEAAKQVSRARLSLQAKNETSVQNRSGPWNDQKIRDWTSTNDSSLIILQGSFQTRDALEQAAVDLIDHLVKEEQEVAWLLNPGTYHGVNVIELPGWGFNGILKQMAVHMLRQSVSFNSLDRLAKLVELFRIASSPEDWFKVIEVALQSSTQMYVILNLGALGSKSSEAECLPDLFLKLFRKPTANRGPVLKVMLLSPRSLGTKEALYKIPVVRINPPRGESATIKKQGLIDLPILTKSKQDQEDQSDLLEPIYNTPNPGGVAGKSKSHSPGDWFNEMKSFEKCIDASRKPWYPRVKIAILDTGLDLSHPDISCEAQGGRIKCHNFIDDSTNVNDLDGHGTHCTSLLAKFAPNAEIYVGRVLEQSQAAEDSAAIVTKAIRHAVEVWKVDIISLSLGFTADDEDMREKILKASANGILVFAAAANNTKNEDIPIRFPARMREVICVFSSDAHGAPSTFNPSPKYDRPNFMFPGENIAGAWPASIQVDGQFMRKGAVYKFADGTSCATPIAAAVAAGILEFAWQERDHQIRKVKLMKYINGMSTIFLKRMVDDHKIGEKSLHYVKPWKLISTRRFKNEVPILISDTMDNLFS